LNLIIVGSDGFLAQYGGWDNLINEFAFKSKRFKKITVINPLNTPIQITSSNIVLKRSFLKGSGFQGILLDIYSIFYGFLTGKDFLFLGTKSFPFYWAMTKIFFWKKNFAAINMAGIEWKRPQFSKYVKKYLRFSYKLSMLKGDHIILDNQFYADKFYDEFGIKPKVFSVIPDGGEIDYSLEASDYLLQKYAFLNQPYFLSISRSIKDNKLFELCNSFKDYNETILVVISNFSNSEYGKSVYKKFNSYEHIFLINGLYEKALLDLIRRHSFAYIHTHTLCGSAPSLIEMIVCKKPIFSIDIPQNRFTLNNEGTFYNSFDELKSILENFDYNVLQNSLPSHETISQYEWSKIISNYEDIFCN